MVRPLARLVNIILVRYILWVRIDGGRLVIETDDWTDYGLKMNRVVVGRLLFSALAKENLLSSLNQGLVSRVFFSEWGQELYK